MNIEKLNIYKQKYQKEYEKFKNKYISLDNDELDKMFYKHISLKEKQKQLDKKLKKKAEKNKKLETQALIIFAKLMLKIVSNEKINEILNRHKDYFIIKRKNKEIDLSKYIRKLMK